MIVGGYFFRQKSRIFKGIYWLHVFIYSTKYVLEEIMERVKKLHNTNTALELTKGTIFSLIISMILIIVFAIIIRFVNIPDSTIIPINQVIKGVSILVGTIIALRGSTKGFLKGLIIGILYAILSYIVFSILSGTLTFGITTITDILFGAVLGAISGLIAVNIGKK